MIRLQFVLGSGLSSQAIAWFSAGHFSHVDAVLENDWLLGARSNTVGLKPPGVQIRPPDYEKWKEKMQMRIQVSLAQQALFYSFLQLQLKKPYDHSAIWGFATGRDWREQDSWFCSELIAAGLETAKVVPPLYAPKEKITPSALATVFSAVGGTW